MTSTLWFIIYHALPKWQQLPRHVETCLGFSRAPLLKLQVWNLRCWLFSLVYSEFCTYVLHNLFNAVYIASYLICSELFSCFFCKTYLKNQLHSWSILDSIEFSCFSWKSHLHSGQSKIWPYHLLQVYKPRFCGWYAPISLTFQSIFIEKDITVMLINHQLALRAARGASGLSHQWKTRLVMVMTF